MDAARAHRAGGTGTQPRTHAMGPGMKEKIMSNVNFRKTANGYAAEYQRNDGCGY